MYHWDFKIIDTTFYDILRKHINHKQLHASATIFLASSHSPLVSRCSKLPNGDGSTRLEPVASIAFGLIDILMEPFVSVVPEAHYDHIEFRLRSLVVVGKSVNALFDQFSKNVPLTLVSSLFTVTKNSKKKRVRNLNSCLPVSVCFCLCPKKPLKKTHIPSTKEVFHLQWI